MHHRSKSLGGALLSLLVVVAWAPASVAGHRVVALTGDPAPDTPTGVVLDNLIQLRVDEQGQVVFRAELAGPGVDSTNQTGLWSEDSGTLRLLARDGDPAPGTEPGVLFDQVGYGVGGFIAAGKAGFKATISGPGLPFSSGGWAGPTGGLSLVARGEDPAPGLPAGTTMGNIFAIVLDPAGKSMVISELAGPDVFPNNTWSVWTDRSGPLELVVRQGDPTPENPATVFGFLGAFYFNARSEVLFTADRAGAGVSSLNDEALYFESAGVIERVALEGDPAPNSDPGLTYQGETKDGSLNDLGQIAYWSALSGGPPFFAIFSNRGGSLAPEVQSQDPAPGTTGTFVYIDKPRLTNAGRLAFRGRIEPGQIYGVWWDQASAGTFAPLIQPDDPIPGTGKRFVSAQQLWYSSSGRLLIDGSTLDVATGSKKSLVLFDPDGSAQILARAGDAFDLFGDGSDLRTVQVIDLIGGLSDNGVAAFMLDFSDGSSGVFASQAFQSVGPGRADNLSVSRNAGMLDLGWDADCGVGTTYGIYRGDLTVGPTSLQPEPGHCALVATNATIPMGLGSAEFLLVVPNDGGAEGSYGTDSGGVSRSPAAAPCFPTVSIDDCASP